MGRAFNRPRPENTVEDYTSRNTLYHRASGRYYSMTVRDGKPVQRRHQIGFDGNPTNVIEKTADFVIGSGNHARSYLHRTPEGKLVQLPVSWYAENGGYWAMSPGYDRPDQQDFRRVMGLNCMFCHNGYPPDRESYSVSSEPVFTEHIPEGIDCQRCHGPGCNHVDAAGSGRASSETIRRVIVYLRQGNTEGARQTLAKALSMNPDEPDANNLMGMACTQKPDRAAAEQYFRKAISAQPDLAAAHHNLANLLASAGDYRQAAWHFEKAIAAAGDYAEAHHRYALALIVLKSYDKALRELREAVRLEPNLAEAHSDLADLLAAGGKSAEAQTHFERANALRHRPPTPPR